MPASPGRGRRRGRYMSGQAPAARPERRRRVARPAHPVIARARAQRAGVLAPQVGLRPPRADFNGRTRASMKLTISSARACGVSTSVAEPEPPRRARMLVEPAQIAGEGVRGVFGLDEAFAGERLGAPLDDGGDLGELVFRMILHAPEHAAVVDDLGRLHGRQRVRRQRDAALRKFDDVEMAAQGVIGRRPAAQQRMRGARLPSARCCARRRSRARAGS